MSDTSKAAIAAAVLGGYALGRTRKGRLALTAVTFIVGRRLLPDPKQLAAEGVRQLTRSPQFAQLSEQVRGQLTDAARSAARAMVDRRIDSLADQLEQRTSALQQGEERSASQDAPRGEQLERAPERSPSARSAEPAAEREEPAAEREEPVERRGSDGHRPHGHHPDGRRSDGRERGDGKAEPASVRRPAKRPTRKPDASSAPRNSARKRTLAHADRK